jgi:hypothetical protein
MEMKHGLGIVISGMQSTSSDGYGSGEIVLDVDTVKHKEKGKDQAASPQGGFERRLFPSAVSSWDV